MADPRRFYEAPGSGARRSAPAALRNREPIAEVLANWLPPSGLVLEIASGTGEHVTYFAEQFPQLDWQPSDIHPDALASIMAARDDSGLSNLRPPAIIDAASSNWSVSCTDSALRKKTGSDGGEPPQGAEDCGFSAVLCINMIHISPWSAALGLLDGAANVLRAGGALILYGPWLKRGIPAAPTNVDFDQQLRERDPAWGLRHVEDFEGEAVKRRFVLEQTRAMPANNLMLLFRLAPSQS